jgi:hypothetical protein
LLPVVILMLSLRSFAEAPPARAADVRLTFDGDDAEFCVERGGVRAKSGMGFTGGEESVRATLAKRAAALGANVVLVREIAFNFVMSGHGMAYKCDADALDQQRAKWAEVERRANTPTVCNAGIDCELKWSRVMLWLQDNSKWKFRNVSESLITTEGPLETLNPAFEATKVPTGDGTTYRIALRAFCGRNGCEKSNVRLRAAFNDFLRSVVPSQ